MQSLLSQLDSSHCLPRQALCLMPALYCQPVPHMPICKLQLLRRRHLQRLLLARCGSPACLVACPLLLWLLFSVAQQLVQRVQHLCGGRQVVQLQVAGDLAS